MKQLFDSEGFLKVLFDTIPVMVLVVDKDGGVHAVNEVTKTTFQIDDQQAHLTAGELFRCIYSKTDPRGCGYAPVCQQCTVRNTALSAMNGKSITCAKGKLNVHRKDQEIATINFLVTSAPIEYERKKFAVVIIEDVSNITELQGLLPICCSCKKVRDDQGYWAQVEKYLEKHSEVEFSHGLCPECLKKLYPQYADKYDPKQ